MIEETEFSYFTAEMFSALKQAKLLKETGFITAEGVFLVLLDIFQEIQENIATEETEEG